jgi:hypothetical protein
VEPGGLMGQLQTVTCWDLMAAESECTAACRMSGTSCIDAAVGVFPLWPNMQLLQHGRGPPQTQDQELGVGG